MVRRGRVIVGMSGGVDSSVAAALLHEQGYEVIGVTMRLWTDEDPGALRGKQRCCSVEDTDDARRVAGQIGIPHYVLNFERPFREHVVDRFVSEYAAGRTPNPCVRCNEHIKYRALFDRLDAFEADYLATGHYARVAHGSDRHRLLRAVDGDKDQTYVLYMLGQEQLGRLLLPVGELRKPEAREHAARLGLDVADKPDSVEICFVPGNDYRTFVQERVEMTPGAMVDATSGETVATHAGIPAYTVGQRKGLGVAVGEPRYVTRLDPERNVVTIGSEDDLYSDTLEAHEVSWTAGRPPADGTAVDAKIRYKAEASAAKIVEAAPGSLTLRFEARQRAVTPGQALCLYDGDEVLGGGTIERAWRSEGRP